MENISKKTTASGLENPQKTSVCCAILGLGEFPSFGPCHPLPPETKVVLGVREETQGPAESAGDPDKRYRRPRP